MTITKAWAVIPTDLPKKHRGKLCKLCYTSAPEIIGGGFVYQIYTDRADAEAFCQIPFADAEYVVGECTINHSPLCG